ncbi:MAG TPA: VOC family protein [Savagea sp.]
MVKFHSEQATFIPQVQINVKDLEASISFYQQVIGLSVIEKKGSHYAALGVDEECPFLILHVPKNVRHPEKNRTGLYHFAILLPDRVSLGVIMRHLMSQNIPFGAADHDVSEALYLSDIDGNGIEIYADRNPDEWKWTGQEVYMTTKRIDQEGLLQVSEGHAWTGKMPKETIMGHLHLHVADLIETHAFYEALGFEIVASGPTVMFMSTSQYHHHIAINVWNGEGIAPQEPFTVGLERAIVRFPSAHSLEKSIERLHQIDATVIKVDERYEAVDPSGNRFTLTLACSK